MKEMRIGCGWQRRLRGLGFMSCICLGMLTFPAFTSHAAVDHAKVIAEAEGFSKEDKTYSQLFDMGSLVDFWLINELKNDGENT